MNKRVIVSAMAALLASGSIAPAFAQEGNFDPGHPRVNQVDQRLQNQQERINKGEADGKLNKHQARRDRMRDRRIARQEHRDMRKHNGHLTKGEQHHLDKEENANSRDIHRQ